MTADPRLPARLERRWVTIGVPSLHDVHGTYGSVDLAAMPPVTRSLDGSLGWLLEVPVCDDSLERGPDDPTERDADRAGLTVVGPGLTYRPASERFIVDPEHRRHIRSATACYLDLGHFGVSVSDGGSLIHFLSDQQWVVHWLLYVGPDGSEAVVASEDPLGFDDGESEPVHLLKVDQAPDALVLCADSFEEFLYRSWAENELFFRLAVDETPLARLPRELRAYAEAFPAEPASDRQRDWLGRVRRADE